MAYVQTPPAQSRIVRWIEAFDRLPPSMQALQIIGMFRSVQTKDEFERVSERWGKLRRYLVEYEKSAECSSSGAAGDREIGMDIIDDVVSAPVDVIINVTKVIVAFQGREKDEFFDALAQTWEAVAKEGWDKLKDKSEEKLSQATAAARRRALQQLQDALVRYLRAWKKRSRKHYVAIIDRVFGLVKTGVSGAMTAASLMLTSSKITPELCGLLKEGDEEQAAASRRVFGLMPLM